MYLKLENYVRQWRGKRVLVIGDAMLDVDMPVDAERASPEYQGGRVLQVSTGMTAAGGAANVATNLKAMGADPYLVAVVGPDANAHVLGACLADDGVKARLVDDMRRPTTTKIRYGRELRVDCESTAWLRATVRGPVMSAIMDREPYADAIILSDYGKGVLCPEVLALVALLDVDCPVVWDPNTTLHRELEAGGVTHMTPNLKELYCLVNTQERSWVPAAWERERAMDTLHRKLGATVVVTRGSEGADVYPESPTGTEHVSTEPVAIDPDGRGAGDTFVAAFTLALAAGADPVHAAMMGNAAAREAVMGHGTVAVTDMHVLHQLGHVAPQNAELF